MIGYGCPFLLKIKYQTPELSYFLKKQLKDQEEKALSASSYGLMA